MKASFRYSTALIGSMLLAASALAAAADRTPAENGYSNQKVVYHVNDAELADAALRNVKNHLNAVGDQNVEIVVVTHGKGIDFLLEDWKDAKGTSMDDAVQELTNRGVQFNICANTLRGRKIEKEKINMNASIVPSGVATVAELQHQGYVYVKP